MPNPIQMTDLKECHDEVVKQIKALSDDLAAKYGIRLSDVNLFGHDQTGQYRATISSRETLEGSTYQEIARHDHIIVSRCYVQRW